MAEPPSFSAELTDEEQTAHDRAAHEAQLQLAWRDALDWAKRGDRRSLVTLLRSEHSLQDDIDVRDYLADVLEGKEKRTRGKPVRRPEYTFASDKGGNVAWVDKRDVERLEIRKWIADNKKLFPVKFDLLEAAAKRFGLDHESEAVIERLENMVSRSSKAWSNSRST